MEFFLKYKQIILRAVGVLLLLIGFVIHFWSMPQEVMSKNDRAAANLARMEKSVQSHSNSSKSKKKPDSSKFLKELKDQQEKQMQYLTIIMMILGASSLGYSFFKRK